MLRHMTVPHASIWSVTMARQHIETVYNALWMHTVCCVCVCVCMLCVCVCMLCVCCVCVVCVCVSDGGQFF